MTDIKVTQRVDLLARLTLSFLWIFTGITSLFFATETGFEVLAKAGIQGPLAEASILSGAGIDIAIGLWMLTGRQQKLCYLVQMIVIVAYTMLLTFIAYEYWLHPFGPLTKNLPVLVLIYVLYSNQSES